MRRRALLAAALALAAAHARAQAVVAVPFYTPPDFMRGLHRQVYAPRAAAFAAQAGRLVEALRQLCAASTPTAPLDPARAAWASAAQAWDALSSVAIGPLVSRRSLLRIDFAPPRPRLIQRALRHPPPNLAALERVGTPAKGLPALEWLLWTQPVQPGTPACGYALLVARDIEREALALAEAFAELAARDWHADQASAVAAMDELLNQWVGGLERLRWSDMEKPVRAAAPGQAPAFPRAAAGSTRSAWATRWTTLRDIGLAQAGAAPAPGSARVPLETYLRGRGLNPLADRLAQAGLEAARALARAEPAEPSSVLAAAGALEALKRLAEAEVAPALDIHIGFSDSDGD